jgi:hypothetical protein
MARDESKKKGGAYPLLKEWRPLVARLFQPFDTSGNRKSYILDPFANTGETVLHLAGSLNLQPFAVELQDVFIPELRENFDEFYRSHDLGDLGLVRAAHDNSFSTEMSHGAYGIVYLNPPYDDMIISDPERHVTADAINRKERFELTALRKFFDRTAINGYVLWVAYSQHMTRPVFTEFRRNCDKISVFRFPEPHLDHYAQVLVVGQYLRGHKKSSNPQVEAEQLAKFIEMGKNPALIKPLDEVCAILDQKQTYLFKNIPQYHAQGSNILFRPSVVDPETTEKLALKYGVHHSSWFKSMTAQPEPDKPIVPQHDYNKSRIAVNLAAGMLDGVRILWKGKSATMRGRVEDVAEVISEEHESVYLKDDAMNRMTRTTLIHPGYRVTIINDDGEIEDVSDPEALMKIISDNSEYMLAELRKRYKPFYDMQIHPVWRKMYKKLKIGGASQFFRAQRRVVACQIEYVACNRKQMVSVAPGGGKTSMSGGVIIGLRILDAAIQYKETGKLNSIAAHFELTGPELMSLLERFEQNYGMKHSDLHTVKPGQVVVVSCPPIAPRIWLEQELPPMYPHFKMRQLKHSTDLAPFFEAAEKDSDPRSIWVGVVTYMDAKLNEGVEPAAATRIKRDRFRQATSDGGIGYVIQASRFAVDPVTGNLIKKDDVLVPWERFTKEKRGKELLMYEGREFWGYKSEIQVLPDGSRKVVKTKTRLESTVVTGKLTPAMIEQNETEGWPRYVSRQYPLYSQVRRIGLPKIGNGRSMTPMKEVVIPSRTIETPRYRNGKCVYETVTTSGGMFQIPDLNHQAPLDPKEKIVDPWIASKGIRIQRDAKKSRPRLPIAGELRRAYSGKIAVFVADEVHLAKSNKTDTGAAFKDMLMASGAVIGLTGTLYGGKSSSLYSLAFHFLPQVRHKYGWSRGAPTSWIEDMGVRKIIEKFDTPQGRNSIRTGGKRVGAPQVKEAPGASPLLMQTMDECTVWMSLDDIGDKMPDKEEHAVCVKFDEMQQAVYDNAYMVISGYNNELVAKGDRTFMASYYTNLLCLPDSMHRDNPVIHRIARDKEAARRKYAEVVEKEVIVVPGIGDEIRPKEKEICDALKQDLKEGRRVIVSVLQTGTRDIRDRITQMITANVKQAKVFSLDTNTKPADRHHHISKMVKQGYNVMITNPALITTAVSLNEWSAWYSVEVSSSLAVHAQATARINRPSQNSRSIVYRHFYYDDKKFQVLAIQGIADKSKAAAVLYGTNAESLSAMMGSDARVADYTALIKAIDAGKARLKSQSEINEALNAKSGGFSDWRESAWYRAEDEADDFGDSSYIFHEDTEILQNGSEEEEEDDDLLFE